MAFTNLFNKLKDYVAGMNIAHLLVLGLIGKSLFTTLPATAVALTVPILGFEAYRLYLKSKSPDPVRINAEVQKELDQVKSKLTALTMKENIEPAKKRYF